MTQIQPGKYWVIHNGNAKEVDLIELNGSPYGSYMYCQKLQCVFYVNDIFQNKLEAVSRHNNKILAEIDRMDKYTQAIKNRLICID